MYKKKHVWQGSRTWAAATPLASCWRGFRLLVVVGFNSDFGRLHFHFFWVFLKKKKKLFGRSRSVHAVGPVRYFDPRSVSNRYAIDGVFIIIIFFLKKNSFRHRERRERERERDAAGSCRACWIFGWIWTNRLRIFRISPWWQQRRPFFSFLLQQKNEGKKRNIKSNKKKQPRNSATSLANEPPGEWCEKKQTNKQTKTNESIDSFRRSKSIGPSTTSSNRWCDVWRTNRKSKNRLRKL